MAEHLAAGADDRRAHVAIAAARDLALALGRRPGIADYIAVRDGGRRDLPSVTVVYRMFRSWAMFLAAADLPPPESSSVSPPDLSELAGAMTLVARALKTDVVSALAYDTYRHTMARPVPSSLVIRRRFGSWEVATQYAGLSTPQRSRGEDNGNG